MTIVNNIEIDHITYKPNPMKQAIQNNHPIEDKLHVIIVLSNPCLYARRYILIKEFIQRIENEETDVLLYVVEMAYKKQRFLITHSKNPRHLQIRTETPLWHKENMINMGIRHLFPKDWKAVAWIDSDLEFENATWAKDTLKVLNGSKDIVQLFSHCVDMDIDNRTMNIFSSFGNQFTKEMPYVTKSLDYWHPGYAWACTRQAYEKMGGLYEDAILGSADNVMALSLIGKGLKAIHPNSSEEYKESVLTYQKRVCSLRLGYVPGVIRHYFHGSKKNRKYMERWNILLKYGFSPKQHLHFQTDGLMVPSETCPQEMLKEIYQYFEERNEDEFFHDKLAKMALITMEADEAEDVEEEAIEPMKTSISFDSLLNVSTEVNSNTRLPSQEGILSTFFNIVDQFTGNDTF